MTGNREEEWFDSPTNSRFVLWGVNASADAYIHLVYLFAHQIA